MNGGEKLKLIRKKGQTWIFLFSKRNNVNSIQVVLLEIHEFRT